MMTNQFITDVEEHVRVLQQPETFEYWTMTARELSGDSTGDTWLLLLNDEWRNGSIRGIDNTIKIPSLR
jgi:hypothetical protein